MGKKDWKTLTTSQLLEEIEKESNDDDWSEIFNALISRSPFDSIYEQIEELKKRIDDAEKENEKLETLIRNHAHLDGNVVVKV